MPDKNFPLHSNCGWPFYAIKPIANDEQSKELLIVAECATYSNNFYHNYLQGKNSDLICPKMDNKPQCIKKLAELIKANNLEKITTIKLNLNCCAYLTSFVETALKLSGKNILIQEIIIDKNGNINM